MKRIKNNKLTKTALVSAATLGLIAGGIAIGKNENKTTDKDTVSNEKNDSIINNKNQKELTFGEYKERLSPITPYIM